MDPVIGQAQLGRVLDGVDPLEGVDGGQQGLAQRGLAAAHGRGHHHVGPHRPRNRLGQDPVQLVGGQAQIGQGPAAGHVRAQHHMGRGDHETLGVQPPVVPDLDVEAGIEVVEALTAIPGEPGQEPGRLHHLQIGAIRAGPHLFPAAGMLHDQALPAPDGELLHPLLGHQIHQGGPGGLHPGVAGHRPVGGGQPLRGGRGPAHLRTHPADPAAIPARRRRRHAHHRPGRGRDLDPPGTAGRVDHPHRHHRDLRRPVVAETQPGADLLIGAAGDPHHPGRGGGRGPQPGFGFGAGDHHHRRPVPGRKHRLVPQTRAHHRAGVRLGRHPGGQRGPYPGRRRRVQALVDHRQQHLRLASTDRR